MKIKYSLKKITDNIYLCTIKDNYDLAMTFCRVQEFYESPFKQIRNKKFKLLKFIKLYSKKKGDGVFTYPADWVGFNIPGTVVNEMFKKGIDDFNEYDKIIQTIHSSIGHNNYYLIAAVNGDQATINHELCHALYYFNKEYRATTDKIIQKILPSVTSKLCALLQELGYTKQVYKDEIQAYLATDCKMFKEVKLSKREKLNLLDAETEFKLAFKKYKNK